LIFVKKILSSILFEIEGHRITSIMELLRGSSSSCVVSVSAFHIKFHVDSSSEAQVCKDFHVILCYPNIGFSEISCIQCETLAKIPNSKPNLDTLNNMLGPLIWESKLNTLDTISIIVKWKISLNWWLFLTTFGNQRKHNISLIFSLLFWNSDSHLALFYHQIFLLPSLFFPPLVFFSFFLVGVS